MVWKSLSAESGSHLRTEKKTEYRARKNRPCCPLPEIAQDGVHRARHALGSDQGHLPSPSPRTGEGTSLERPSPERRRAPGRPRPRHSRRVRAGGMPVRSTPTDDREKGCAKSVVAPAKPAIAAPNNRKMPNALKRRNEFVCASRSNQQGTLEQKPSQLRRGRFSHIRHKDRCCEDGRRRRCPWNARR